MLANLMFAATLLGQDSCQAHIGTATRVAPAQAGRLKSLIGAGRGTRLSTWAIWRYDCDPEASMWIAAGLIGNDAPYRDIGIGVDVSGAHAVTVWIDGVRQSAGVDYTVLSTDGGCIRLSFVNPLASGTTLWILVER